MQFQLRDKALMASYMSGAPLTASAPLAAFASGGHALGSAVVATSDGGEPYSSVNARRAAARHMHAHQQHMQASPASGRGGSGEEFIASPSIAAHGLISDRRTAALAASDGTIDWLCLRDFDELPVFGALVDAERGGHFRLGPRLRQQGRQSYPAFGLLETAWEGPWGELRVTDVMPWPHELRSPGGEARRALIRHLRCTRGQAECALRIMPRGDFHMTARVTRVEGGADFVLGPLRLGLFFPRPWEPDASGVRADFTLAAGEDVWAVLALDEPPEHWNAELARRAMDETAQYWADWATRISYNGEQRPRVLEAAVAAQMLGYAPDSSLVAAPTTSLPERLGGDRNYDYRYTWIRDASLCCSAFSMVGDVDTAGRFIDWLAGLSSVTESPLQVAYDVRGGTDLAEHTADHLAGYRGSTPVVFGNRAYKQKQLGSLGYVADCAWELLLHGGKLPERFLTLLARLADYTAEHWREPDSGIWELTHHAHFVTSKVMSWVVLDRALRVRERVDFASEGQRRCWADTAEAIREEVLARGYSPRLECFRQRFDSETALDAGVLLIPLMGMLPADDERVRRTMDRIVSELSIDGFVYRFCPADTPEEASVPLGQLEGAFVPCTLWLATCYALAGRLDEAEATLAHVEATTGGAHLLSEELDPRSRELLGNYPLLFSHVEYIRARVVLAGARRGRRRGKGRLEP